MPNQDQPLDFPSKGLDVSREIRQQPDKTTADCQNVASRDSITNRDRGGSRPGFSKYIDDQGSEGAVVVQMLEVLIDPTTDALIQNFETPDDDWTEHPRIPGIFIPPHGAPWQPTPNASQPPKRSGGGTINAVGRIEGEGEAPGGGSGPTCTEWTVDIVMKPGFGDIFNGSGTAEIVYCDCADPESIDTGVNGSVPASPGDLEDADAFAAYLQDNGIGNGNAAELFDTYERTAGGSC